MLPAELQAPPGNVVFPERSQCQLAHLRRRALGLVPTFSAFRKARLWVPNGVRSVGRGLSNFAGAAAAPLFQGEVLATVPLSLLTGCRQRYDTKQSFYLGLEIL